VKADFFYSQTSHDQWLPPKLVSHQHFKKGNYDVLFLFGVRKRRGQTQSEKASCDLPQF
jgi:hypothetical protein